MDLCYIVEKLHYMAANIYCAGAGTAADCDKTTATISSQLELLRFTHFPFFRIA